MNDDEFAMSLRSAVIFHDEKVYSRSDHLIVSRNLEERIVVRSIVVTNRLNELAAVGKDPDRAVCGQTKELEPIRDLPGWICLIRSRRICHNERIRYDVDFAESRYSRSFRQVLRDVCPSAFASERID
jgi:hypothetical protein